MAKRRGVIADEPANAMAYCIKSGTPAEFFVLLLTFTTHKKGVHGGFENTDRGGRAKQEQHDNQPAQRSHNDACRRADAIRVEVFILFIVFTTHQMVRSFLTYFLSKRTSKISTSFDLFFFFVCSNRTQWWPAGSHAQCLVFIFLFGDVPNRSSLHPFVAHCSDHFSPCVQSAD